MGSTRTQSRRRGASLYLTVTGVGLMVSVMALTAGVVSRLQIQTTSERADNLKAQAAAHSGLEHALNWINRNADWRTRLASGSERDDVLISGGAGFRWRVTDADNDLADDPRDHAVLRSVGFVNNRGRETAYAYEVDIEPAGRGLTCLSSAVHTQAEIDAGSGSTIRGSGTVTSNNGFFAQGSEVDIQLAVEVNSTVTGSGFNGGLLEGAVLRENPGEHVFDWYVQRGTRVAFSDLQAVFASSDRRVSGEVISRVLSPFGEPNPLGIYIIDCESQDVRIRWSRVLGTLVLLNAGSGTRVEDVSVLASVPANHPALLVQGDLEIDLSSLLTGQSLFEGLGVSYNPPGAPDASGVEDTDDEDNYPAQIEGIVYATGTIRVSDDARVIGNLIADRVVIDSGKVLDIEHRPYAADYPPPGFSAGLGARVLPGTLRRVGVD